MEAINRTLISNDWVALAFLFGIVLLFLMKVYNPQRLIGYFTAFYTQGFVEKSVEEDEKIFSLFHGFLFLFNINTVSLAIYFLSEKSNTHSPFIYFISIFSGITTYFLCQLILTLALLKILEIKKQIQYFSYSKAMYLYTSSLWLFSLLIIYEYGFKNISFLTICIVLFIAFRAFLIISNNKKLIFKELFYFILYFCTLELAPFLIIYKITTN